MCNKLGSKEDDDNDRRHNEGAGPGNEPRCEEEFLKLSNLADRRGFWSVEGDDDRS